MKKLMALIVVAVISTSVFAGVRCVPSGTGTCCWDTDREGPYKPIGC